MANVSRHGRLINWKRPSIILITHVQQCHRSDDRDSYLFVTRTAGLEKIRVPDGSGTSTVAQPSLGRAGLVSKNAACVTRHDEELNGDYGEEFVLWKITMS